MKVFLEFSDKKAELQPGLYVLCTAVNGILVVVWICHCVVTVEVLSSSLLKRILYIVLVTGNMINSVSKLCSIYVRTIVSPSGRPFW